MSKTLFPQDQASKDFADLKFLDDGQIAHLTYSSFGATTEEGQAFMKRSFEAIQSKGSRALILDLRGNGGGQDELGKLLFSYLVDTPFKYYDDLFVNKWSFSFSKYTDHDDLTIPKGVAELRADGRVHALNHPNLGLQQPSKPTFTGPVYILINGGCFSTTSEFLSQAHFHHRATFIGEESAGGYYGNTSGTVVKLTLPNTKLGIYLPLVSYYVAVSGNHEAARGVIPDFRVKHTIADLVAGVDKDFEHWNWPESANEWANRCSDVASALAFSRSRAGRRRPCASRGEGSPGARARGTSSSCEKTARSGRWRLLLLGEPLDPVANPKRHPVQVRAREST